MVQKVGSLESPVVSDKSKTNAKVAQTAGMATKGKKAGKKGSGMMILFLYALSNHQQYLHDNVTAGPTSSNVLCRRL